MSQYLTIAKYNLRISLFPHILLGLVVILLTPVIFGTTALDSNSILIPLELFVPFVGVVMLTPTFLSESDTSVSDTVLSKQVPYTSVCLVRVIISLLVMLAYIAGFIVYLKLMESDASISHIFICYSSAVFLGGLGMFATSVSGNIVIGYIVPILYYVLDFMGSINIFNMTLFSMTRGGDVETKITLFAVGLALVILGLITKQLMIKLR